MDPRRNPYAPGAGAPPPELAGRDKLIDTAAIAKGMIYSPAHGDTAFTVPLFDAYLRRVVPFESDP